VIPDGVLVCRGSEGELGVMEGRKDKLVEAGAIIFEDVADEFRSLATVAGQFLQ
jgi:hypothetical protein